MLPSQLDDWRLVKLTGWTFAEIDAAPAERTDWLLKIDDVMNTPLPEEGD